MQFPTTVFTSSHLLFRGVSSLAANIADSSWKQQLFFSIDAEAVSVQTLIMTMNDRAALPIVNGGDNVSHGLQTHYVISQDLLVVATKGKCFLTEHE